MKSRIAFSVLLVLTLIPALAGASSHREAPGITEMPKVDGTDFYMFHSYEAGRSGYVTLIANYVPLQDAYGGPNYFSLDPDARYRIHVDNSGDGVEDVSFQFRCTSALADIALPVVAVLALVTVDAPPRYVVVDPYVTRVDRNRFDNAKSLQ